MLNLWGAHACTGHFPAAFDHDHAVQAGPGMSLLEPGDIVNGSGGSGLDATMIAIDRAMAGHLGIGEVPGLLLSHEQFDILPQGALVAFRART